MLLNRYELKVYQAGLKFVFYVAVKKVLKCDINFAHSLDKGLYVKFITKRIITSKDIDTIKEEMNKIIEADHRIVRKVVSKKDAYDFYVKANEYEKAGNILNLNNKTVTLYELCGYYNYFISSMPESTGNIKYFDLYFLGNNDLLLTHASDDTYVVPDVGGRDKIFESFAHYNDWMDALGVKYVYNLNKIISENKVRDFIKKNDIMMDNQLYNLAVQIKESGKKVIFLGGPSSSGKTTSTKKLGLYLSTFGYNPIYLGVDDYYEERDKCPKDEKGEYDFESLEALDIKLFNDHLNQMLEGREVSVPHFNFITGKKEYKGRVIKLKEDDIILIEGLHCLNEKMSQDVARDKKMKIYISPFTPLNIDRHNHVSTIDIRLIRRLVRDNWSRGASPEVTLNMWEKVRNGETKYIFPFTSEADAVLNTAFVYEMGVLRIYAEPLLYAIKPESKHFQEARRLLNFIQVFFPIPSEFVNSDNILREFIGGSYFDERK